MSERVKRLPKPDKNNLLQIAAYKRACETLKAYEKAKRNYDEMQNIMNMHIKLVGEHLDVYRQMLEIE